MTIIAFTSKSEIEASGWTPEERCQLEALYAARVQRGEASDWTDARAETGAPQFFLFGPAPDCACILSVSRIDRSYIVEDGNGGALFEADSLDAFLEAASRLRLGRVRTVLVAKFALAFAACREFAAEKTEALAGEAIEAGEVLAHFIPQVAAFA
jgi:hypothetical protein